MWRERHFAVENYQMSPNLIKPPRLSDAAFFHPRGSGAPTPTITAKTTFALIDDNDVGRDMMDLEGPGGPDTFDMDIAKILREANKVIVAVGGPSLLVHLLMQAAARSEGYYVVVDTPASRIATWVELTAKVRNGQRGLAILAPRSVIPPEFQDRCAGDPAVESIIADAAAQRALH